MTIERAAKAIHDQWLSEPDVDLLARAALESISEPTPEMIETGSQYWPDNDWANINSAACWRAMHAAMMKNHGPGT